MKLLSYYLSILLLLCIITSPTTSFSQEGDPLNQLFQDITRFIYFEVIINNNPNCQRATYNLLEDTQLGQIMSEFFEIHLEMNLRAYLLNQYSEEHEIDKTRQSRQNLLGTLLWMEQKRQSTTPEDINTMREELEDLEAQWDSCLQTTFP